MQHWESLIRRKARSNQIGGMNYGPVTERRARINSVEGRQRRQSSRWHRALTCDPSRMLPHNASYSINKWITIVLIERLLATPHLLILSISNNVFLTFCNTSTWVKLEMPKNSQKSVHFVLLGIAQLIFIQKILLDRIAQPSATCILNIAFPSGNYLQ